MNFDFCLDSVLHPKKGKRSPDLNKRAHCGVRLQYLLCLDEIRDISKGIDPSAVVASPALLEGPSGNQQKIKILILDTSNEALYERSEKVIHFFPFWKMLKKTLIPYELISL